MMQERGKTAGLPIPLSHFHFFNLSDLVAILTDIAFMSASFSSCTEHMVSLEPEIDC
jgi:hypothetical protein